MVRGMKGKVLSRDFFVFVLQKFKKELILLRELCYANYSNPTTTYVMDAKFTIVTMKCLSMRFS